MASPSFEFINAWQCMGAAETGELLGFWEREHADVPEAKVDERLRQVVVRVIAPDGRLAAVSTAEPKTIPRLGQPLYYYRCFVGAEWRNGRLLRPLLRRSFDVLETWAREHDFPCIGVLLELENAAFADALQEAVWPTSGFAFIGCSKRGLDLRVSYFHGARLKPRR